MKISHEWLRAFVPHALAPEEVGELLSRHVVSLEGLERTRADLAPIVVARVVESRKIPDTKLSFNLVDDGSGTPVEVVCGAPNVAVGTRYPFARVGTVMPGGLKIEARKIYGEYMAKYKAAQQKEEARMLAEREKLKAQLEKHLKLLTVIEKSKREAEAARQQAQAELERLETQLLKVKTTLDNNALKLLQQQRQAAELRLERTQNEVKEVAQEHKAVEDALAKSRWKLEQQAVIQKQLEDDLEIVMDSPDEGAQAAARDKKSARNAVDDLFDEITSQLRDKGQG